MCPFQTFEFSAHVPGVCVYRVAGRAEPHGPPRTLPQGRDASRVRVGEEATLI